MGTFDVEESNCPHCGAVFDMVTGVNSDEKPSEGDVSVCIDCGNVNTFDSEGNLEMASDEFMSNIKENYPEDYNKLMDVVIAIKARL